MDVALTAFYLLCDVVVFALIIEALLSWIAGPMMYRGQYNMLTKFYFFLNRVTEPIIRPARKFMSRFNTGPLDLSIIVTVFFIYLLKRAVNLLMLNLF